MGVEAYYIGSLFAGIAVAVFFVVLAFVILNVAIGRKTKNHRKKLVDMYVSGMIRKFAKEDSIDLDEEYQFFIKESKREKLSEKELDNVVEDELSEKIIKANEKKVGTKKVDTKKVNKK